MTGIFFSVLITLISYLIDAHYVLNTILGSLHTLPLPLFTILWDRNYYPNFNDEETEACRCYKNLLQFTEPIGNRSRI